MTHLGEDEVSELGLTIASILRFACTNSLDPGHAEIEELMFIHTSEFIAKTHPRAAAWKFALFHSPDPDALVFKSLLIEISGGPPLKTLV